jgi:hypothetical protein
MKYKFIGAAIFLWGAILFAENPKPVSLNLLWSGSWEDSKTLHNRGEIKLIFPLPDIILRGEILDRRPLNFDLDSPWGDPEKWVTNYLGGIYHKPTGSRLLYGVLDEWGLPARIRNPWIRSAPFVENHKPVISDLKTAASATKAEEVFLYLSTPYLNFFNDIKFRGFASTQTKTEIFLPEFSLGLDTKINKETSILLEAFHTGSVLPKIKSSTWFSDPPPLPEREFNLYAFALLINSPLISISSDLAYSETFAWGFDIYGNLGIRITPLIPVGRIKRPLSISFAADGAGERFIYRDGLDHGAGLRCAGKIEWKGGYNSLFRINTTLRSPGIGEDFNRSSSGLYYRFPAKRYTKDSFPVKLTRISVTADRNAVNLKKINDGISGNIGFSIFIPQTNPLGINFTGFFKGISTVDSSEGIPEEIPSPFPFLTESWEYDSTGGSCELSWSPGYFQFRAKCSYAAYAKKDETWDISFYTALKFKHGRFSIKAASSDFYENWDWTVTWRLEMK